MRFALLLAALVGALVLAPGAVAARFPVVHCPTSFGGPGPHPKPPASVTLSVPADAAGRLTAYSDGDALLLAPRGWACRGLVGADGTAQLTAFPRGERAPSFADLRPPRPQAVVLE